MSPTDHEKGVAALQGTASAKPVIAEQEPPLGLRSVAMFEVAKGILFLLLGLSALSFEHRDIAVSADVLIRKLHLDPTWHYSKMFISEVSKLSSVRLKWIGIIGTVLAAVRLTEGYFLWHQKAWAEWFAVISSCIYLPFELQHFYARPDFLGAAIFVVNLVIVVYLAMLLYSNKKERKDKLDKATKQGGI